MKKTILITSFVALLLGGAAGLAFTYLGAGPAIPPGDEERNSGQVIDAVNTPVEGAVVKFDGFSTRSQASGAVALPTLRDGDYKVTISSRGHSTDYTLTYSGGRISEIDGQPAEEDLLLSLPFFAKDYRQLPPIDPAKDIVRDTDGLLIVKDTALVKWTQDSSDEERETALAAVPGAKVRGEIREIDVTQITVPPGGLAAAIAALEKEPAVEGAIKDYVATPQYRPADADWRDGRKNWWLRKVEAPMSWEVSAGNRRTTVAVIDAGFQLDHQDLSGVFIDDLATNYTSEDIGLTPSHNTVHGTHVSGIIAMQANRIGLVGIAPRVRIMPIKVATFADQAAAIILASRTRGVSVINMSMGINWNPLDAELVAQGRAAYTARQKKDFSDQQDLILVPAVQEAKRQGVVMVHAAGNDGAAAAYNTLNTPIAVTVANAGKNDRLDASSNSGAPVSISAPGTEIWSASTGDSYEYLTGTSMASPLVAGTIAAMRAVNPRLTVDQTLELLTKSAQTVRGAPPRLNAWQAVLAATGLFGVQGRLVDGDGNPVARAVISYPGPPARTVTTDAEGRFRISSLPRTGSDTLSIQAGETVELRIQRPAADIFVLRDYVLRLPPVAAPPTTAPKEKETAIAFKLWYFKVNCYYDGKGPDPYPKKFLMQVGNLIDLSGTNFTGTKPSVLGSQVYGMVDKVSLSGSVSELREGGVIKVDMRGVYLNIRQGGGGLTEVPVRIAARGIITKKEQFTTKVQYVSHVNKVVIVPFRITDTSESGEPMPATCKFNSDTDKFGGSVSKDMAIEVRD